MSTSFALARPTEDDWWILKARIQYILTSVDEIDACPSLNYHTLQQYVGYKRGHCGQRRTQERKPNIQPRLREGVDEVEIAQERLKNIGS